MRVLALTKYGTLAASTRQRLVQFEPVLAAAGISVTAAPFFDDDHVARLAIGKPIRPADILRAYARRLATLLRLGTFDLVWVQYEILPYMPGALELLWTASSKPIIVDLDDAIFHMYDDNARSAVRTLLGGKMLPLLKRAAAITVGNAYLANYVSAVNANVTIVPTVVNTDVYRPAPHPAAAPAIERPLTVGWIGSPSTWRYAEQILPTILPQIAENGARFLAVGAGPAGDRWQGVENRNWTEASEVASVQDMDIGVMPLPDERWARGKCGYKLIQYMACGLPTIASPVGVNSEIVEPGQTGFLAVDPEDWTTALQRLLDDAALRQRFGQAGRRRVIERYSLASQEPRVRDVFEQAVMRRR
ncbi:glycosyltransferase family 4 protein [Sphingomonas sp. TREG-RG-20F-R18-01]|uniref:glycosyltransferase family 4 protein n=1 Tax=Sphingomonas sp. TREG-RG-20F-R18-01 TaxID=2914982 RepID=UPI001F5744B9|nr:glycosyltransferase family 4 protein [Sphingomonas sp. TREG-RG-20F-R18-01]